MSVLAKGDKGPSAQQIGINQLCGSQPWGWIPWLRGASAEALMTSLGSNIIQDSQEFAYPVHKI